MVRFAEVFSDLRIVQALSAQLSWSHFTYLMLPCSSIATGSTGRSGIAIAYRV